MCLLQDGENFQTDRKLLEVEVATRGQLELMVRDEQVSEGLVRLTEGDEVDLECKVQKAFPRPSISWSGLEVDKRVGRETRTPPAPEHKTRKRRPRVLLPLQHLHCDHSWTRVHDAAAAPLHVCTRVNQTICM